MFVIPASVRVVLFDAVGTVIYPSPPVAEAYHAAGARHGSMLPVTEIKTRFRQALLKLDAFPDGAATWTTSEAGERERWRRIVEQVFDDIPQHDRLFDELWDHFAAPPHWALFDDVPDCWRRLTAAGLSIGLASNFDARLEGICHSLPPLSTCDRVFVSSRLGHRKPGPGFFRTIERELDCRAEELLLVGDDPANDHAAALAAGWHAVLIDRCAPHLPPEINTRASGVRPPVPLRSLTQLQPCPTPASVGPSPPNQQASGGR